MTGSVTYVDGAAVTHSYSGPLTVGLNANTDGIQACEDVNGTYQVAPANATPGSGRGVVNVTPVTGSVTNNDQVTTTFNCNLKGSYKRASTLLELRVQTVVGQCTIRGANDNAAVAVPGGINLWADVHLTFAAPPGAPALGRVTGATIRGDFGVSDNICRPWGPLQLGDVACP